MSDQNEQTTKHESTVTLMGGRVRKDDTTTLITNATENFPDDAFSNLYMGQSGSDRFVQILEPTFKPSTLKAITTQNNILLQCIDAMEVNIDGTGFTIELWEGEKEDEKEKQVLQDFFDEPYPGKSMIGIRREMRNDLESTGNGYFEVSRSMSDEIQLLNYIDSCDLRLIRLDDPVFVTKTIMRRGKEVKVKMRVRERRFVQLVNGKKVYFKEFGASRDLDRNTGKWAEGGARLSFMSRASELIHFTGVKEAKTPYGAPRWINQLPSVLGSRKAEEFNLEFFDSGGLPPVLVIVQGGYLGAGVKDSLNAHLNGRGANHRAAIVEAISSSGSLDSAGSVKVTVERFGTERQQDSMFQAYDKNAEEHVRIAFRLPPLFIGRAQDYNFATAKTGYMVAEAQVFLPERNEFDEKMWQITKAMGVKKYVFKSKPLTLTDIEQQLKAIELGLTNKIVEGEEVIATLNDLTGMNLVYQEPPATPGFDKEGNPLPRPVSTAAPAGSQTPSSTPANNDPNAVNSSTKPKLSVVKAEDFSALTRIIKLADEWTTVLGLAGPCNMSEGEIEGVKKSVNELEGAEQKLFNELIASKSLVNIDAEGLAELCGHAAVSLMGR